MRLERQIGIGFAGGVIVGALVRATAAQWPPLTAAVVALEPLGTVFIRSITMVVVPLVVASVFVGVASLGNVRALGRVGGKTLLYFLGTTLAAAIIGLVVAVVGRVGQGLSGAERAALLADPNVQSGTTAAIATVPPTIVQTLVGLIPQNPFAAAATGDLLPLIVAVCIFAAAATVTNSDGRQTVVRFFEGVNELSLVVITWLMRLAPAGVFVLIAVTIAKSGLGLLARLAEFALVVVLALVVHVGVTLLPALRLGARMGVRQFTRATSDALLLAFSTASSNATLPVSIAAARDRLQISPDVVGFVLPAGASINKNGAAAYKAVTAVFLAQLYGLPLTGGTMLTIALTSTLAAFAGTGVPGSSLVTTLIVLNAIGLGPHAAAGIALVAAVDRPLDMCRTTVNTIGNLIGAAWVARSEASEVKVGA
jgi:DAACS family dicarboxylate/amino acid:cation (Na+ or H+) symporter